jgi:hypothetical protein
MAEAYKYSTSVNVKFDKILQKDEHVVLPAVYGNNLAELNLHAQELIGEYKAFNGIDATAEYYLFETPGSVASTLKAIGKV